MRALVVGGGLAGASVAGELARAGAEVVLADAGLEGAATSAGAGILQEAPSIVEPGLAALHDASIGHYRELVGRLAALGADDVGYRVTGGLWLDTDPAPLVELRDRLAVKREYAHETLELLEPARVVERLPVLDSRWWGLLSSRTARVDGRLLRAALIDAARAAGASVETGEVSLRRRRGRVAAELDGRPVAADLVVVAAGAWIDRLLAPVGVRLGVVPQRGQLVHLRPGSETRDWPPAVLPSGRYLLSFDGSRTVIGTTRDTLSGFDPSPDAGGQLELLAELLDAAPGLRSAAVLETRTGLRPLSLDGRPHAGVVEEGLAVLGGLGPSGLKLGPLLGSELARLLLGASPMPELAVLEPRVEREPLSSGR